MLDWAAGLCDCVVDLRRDLRGLADTETALRAREAAGEAEGYVRAMLAVLADEPREAATVTVTERRVASPPQLTPRPRP